jgi:hypothetical protein
VLGLIAGWVLGFVIPSRFLLTVLLVFMGLAGLFFLLFHLGLCDFQEY